jgi:hypothetical protein
MILIERSSERHWIILIMEHVRFFIDALGGEGRFLHNGYTPLGNKRDVSALDSLFKTVKRKC